MDFEAAERLGADVFERYRVGDLPGVREAAAAYRVALQGEDPDVLAALTSDVEGLDLEVAATRGDANAMEQAEALFMRYALRPEPDLPAAAVFALRAKAVLLANARRRVELEEVAEQLTEFIAARDDAGRQEVIADHALEVAYMTISARGFITAIDLLGTLSERMGSVDSPAARSLRARAQMLQVVAILSTGDTTRLPPVLRDLHAGGQDTLAAIDALLTRWAGHDFWGGARISALGNKLVLLDALDRRDEITSTRTALDAELTAMSLPLEADTITDEIHEALEE